MNIAIVCPYDLAEEGGVKRHAFNLARALRRGGDDVTLVGASSRTETEPGVVGFSGIINLPNNGSDNRIAFLTPPWRIRRFFREGGFDVVHIMEPQAPLLSAWSVLFAKEAARVGTFHAFSEDENLFSRFCRWWSTPILFPRLERAIAVSRPAAEYQRGHWTRDLALIPNGIDTQAFTAGAFEERKGPVRLLFVGQWRDRRKGLPDLLEAYQRLRARGVDVTLDVIGAGPSGQKPQAIEGVTWHGQVSDEKVLAAHYRACDVFVAPSLGYESFGIVLLEAMASARPIVCTDIEGYRQVVADENARLVKPGDIAALETAIAGLAADPALRRKMGEANRRCSEAYDWSRLASRVREEYVMAIALRFGIDAARAHERSDFAKRPADRSASAAVA